MAATPIWAAIAETLADELASGHYGCGERLPTEAALAARFDVNRHTLRRALADLAARGLVRSRRGAGTFAAARPVAYPLGRRVRFHRALRAAGHAPERAVLRLETRRADAREAAALALGPEARVHVYEGVSLADSVPIALFRSVFPAARLPGLCATLAVTASVTEALAREGVADYTRAATELTAKTATATQARHLGIAEGAALLRTVGVNVAPSGEPVEHGRTWFAGERVSLTVTPDD